MFKRKIDKLQVIIGGLVLGVVLTVFGHDLKVLGQKALRVMDHRYSSDHPVSDQYSREFEAMRCHKPHDLFMDKEDEKLHPLSEHPMYFENGRWNLKIEFSQALQLWRQAQQTHTIGFAKNASEPLSSISIDMEHILQRREEKAGAQYGLLVMGCTDRDGNYRKNMSLSFDRAINVAKKLLQEREICILPLSENCDDLGFSSGLIDYTGQHKGSENRFVSIRTYKRTFDEPPSPSAPAAE